MYLLKFFFLFFSLSRNGKGVFISDVVKGGAADLDGRLMQGDQILSVDGEDMRQASQETVAAILKVSSARILKTKACLQHVPKLDYMSRFSWSRSCGMLPLGATAQVYSMYLQGAPFDCVFEGR